MQRFRGTGIRSGSSRWSSFQWALLCGCLVLLLLSFQQPDAATSVPLLELDVFGLQVAIQAAPHPAVRTSIASPEQFDVGLRCVLLLCWVYFQVYLLTHWSRELLAVKHSVLYEEKSTQLSAIGRFFATSVLVLFAVELAFALWYLSL